MAIPAEQSLLACQEQDGRVARYLGTGARLAPATGWQGAAWRIGGERKEKQQKIQRKGRLELGSGIFYSI